jgi:hypothetical protein
VAVTATSGTLVGVYPMDYLAIHRVVSFAFFLSSWTVAAVFTLWLLTTHRPTFPRWLLAPGCLAVVVDLIFIGVYSTYRPANPDAPILDRPTVWAAPLLEWASLLTLLLWIGCVALVLLRRPSEYEAQTRPLTSNIRPAIFAYPCLHVPAGVRPPPRSARPAR